LRIAGRDKRPLGSAIQNQLVKLGITREPDLVLHLPLRYEDHTRITPLRALRPGVVAQTEGVVVNSDVQYRPRRQLVALLGEADAPDTAPRAPQLVLRFFHFYPSMQKTLSRGKRLRVFGEVREGYYGAEMVHPQLRTIEGDAPLPDRLTPVYPTTAGLTQETLRKLTARVMAASPALMFDTLPNWLVKQRRFLAFGEAVHFLHAPPPGLSEDTQRGLDERTHPAWTRLKFDELVAQQLSLKAHRRARALKRAPVLTGTNALTGALLERLPFALTGAQQRVWREIRADLARMTPMQRLLQGDVGSGKTVVAALAALQAIESGRQAAFMAPTEILAEQHYRKLLQWLADLPIEIAWLSGSLPA
jgi:ATP-dependent DNA helicase RecG